MDIEHLAGTRLGNYQIESLLGRGGMGVVYKATQISLNRPVALKILPPTLSSDASFVKRFHREAEAIARLHHANIVQIYDISEDQDLRFFSMEYMEGQTLDEILKEKGRLHVDEAVRIVSQAAQGIAHAHKNGIIHRDIKPSNIILDNDGNVKVMDFGLARSTKVRSRLTQSGTLMGTLDYMSPEQCRGDELDERTDIYSLGVVLYETLTGRVPFEAPNEAALIHSIIYNTPADATEMNPEISHDLGAVLSRTMAKDKEGRFGKMIEFLDDMRRLPTGPSWKQPAEEESSPSIVVLPFVDMSSGKDQEYFCDGISEALINELTQIRDLKVVARTSAFSFKAQNLDIREIGRKLNVKSVLEGSVQKAGNRLRITAQLVNVSDGYHLWSERYDRDMDDIFAIQDEISEAIVDRLKPALLKKEKGKLARRQTVDIETYDLYLKGRYFLNKYTPDSLNKAIEYFEQAIAEDPHYAPAYAGLADTFLLFPFYASSPPQAAYQKGRRAAIRALELDDTLAEAHNSLGLVKSAYDWDWEGAEKEFKQAIELNPGHADSRRNYALHLVRLARSDEAIEEIEYAHKLDPFSLNTSTFLGGTYFYARRYDQAIAASQKTIEMDPNFPYAHLFLGMAYWQKSMYEEAFAEFQRERDISGIWNSPAEFVIGISYALLGKRDEAAKILDTFLKCLDEEYIPSTFLAIFYFALGESDHGFEWLNKAYEEGDNWLCYMKVDRAYDPVRSDPRYEAMLKKMGLDR